MMDTKAFSRHASGADGKEVATDLETHPILSRIRLTEQLVAHSVDLFISIKANAVQSFPMEAARPRHDPESNGTASGWRRVCISFTTTYIGCVSRAGVHHLRKANISDIRLARG